MCKGAPDVVVEPEASWEWPGWLTAFFIAVVVGIITLLLGLFTYTPLWVTAGIGGGIVLGVAFGAFSYYACEVKSRKSWIYFGIPIAVGIIGIAVLIWLGGKLEVQIGTHVATPIVFAVIGFNIWSLTVLLIETKDD